MCCRTRIVPVRAELAIAQLEIGQFREVYPGSWRRIIEEEQTYVTASLQADSLLLSLSPAVSSWTGHHDKRIAASVAYEIAARYAEKVNGVITQEGINVPDCRIEGHSSRTLAIYPETRLDFSLLCPGFRAVFLGEGEGEV